MLLPSNSNVDAVMEGRISRQSGECLPSIVKELQNDLIEEGLLSTSEVNVYVDEFCDIVLIYSRLCSSSRTI
jgi:hypothetical protein